MNKVILVGRLVKDPVAFSDGRVVKIKLATRVGYDVKNKKERVAFVPITVFSLSRPQIDKLKKGICIGVEGIVAETSFKRNNEMVYLTDVQVGKSSLHFF